MTPESRTFMLTVHPDETGGYSLDLSETTNNKNRSVGMLEGASLERMRLSVLTAVTASKHPRTALTPRRRAPITLTEDAGIRLALTLLTVKPLAKPARVEAIRQGIDTMTSEEALYWYANCTGTNSARALKALRILLADE